MSDDEENTDCKIVLIGESGVGKTSIITRLTKDEFSENQETTMGASYTTKVIKLKKYEGREIKVNIWDTAGQEAYRSLTKIFYKEASIAILVYDITKKDSFTEMKDYWYQQLIEFGEPNVIFGIAGNKADLFDNEEVNEQEARAFAKEINAVYKPTSAATNLGIDDLFEELCGKLLGLDNAAAVQKPDAVKLDEKKTEKKKKGGCC